MVAIKGRDPRPTASSQLGTDFICITKIPVSYGTEARWMYSWLHHLVEALAEDLRFRTGKMSTITQHYTDAPYSSFRHISGHSFCRHQR